MNIPPKSLEEGVSIGTQDINHEENDAQQKIGLEHRYVDLADPENLPLRKKIVKENFSYASYLYMGNQEGQRYLGDKDGILFSTCKHISKLNGVKSLSKGKTSNLKEQLNHVHIIENRLKSAEFGFKVDDNGNYYHLETGTIFNLVFDHYKNEVIIAFVGLNQHDHLLATEEEKEAVRDGSFRTVLQDFRGSLPAAVLQCIAMGRMMKEVVADTDIKPVMIGHSHGGGLAQASAIANNLQGVIFNSRSLGVATRALIGENVIQANAKKITAFSVRGDWLTEAKTIGDCKPAFETLLKTNFIAAGLFFMFKDTPLLPNEGQGYYLPQPEGTDAVGAHRHFYQALQILR